MDVYYNGEHRVFFGEIGTSRNGVYVPSEFVDSWNDLHLIPAARPSVASPKMKSTTIAIPGANGVLDLTDFPRGFPTFDNRTGSLEFYVNHSINWGPLMTEDYEWTEALADITRRLHGKRTKMYLGDNLKYYYYGRFTVGDWKTGKNVSTVTINYDLDPYMYCTTTAWDDQYYNPFTSEWVDAEMPKPFLNIHTNEQEPRNQLSLYSLETGSMQIIPKFRYTVPGYSNVEMYAQVHTSFNDSTSPMVKLGQNYEEIEGLAFANPGMYDETTFTFFLKAIDSDTYTPADSGMIWLDFRSGRL